MPAAIRQATVIRADAPPTGSPDLAWRDDRGRRPALPRRGAGPALAAPPAARRGARDRRRQRLDRRQRDGRRRARRPRGARGPARVRRGLPRRACWRRRRTSSRSWTPTAASTRPSCPGCSDRSWTAAPTWCSGRRRPTSARAWPWHLRYANRVLTGRLERRTGLRLHDLGPMRAARRSALLDLRLTDRRSGYPLEMVVRAADAALVRGRGGRRLRPPDRPLEGHRHAARGRAGRARHVRGARLVTAGVRARTLVLLAKEPVPGRVKTRLHSAFTPVEAAALASAAIEDTVRAMAATPPSTGSSRSTGGPGRGCPAGFDVVRQPRRRPRGTAGRRHRRRSRPRRSGAPRRDGHAPALAGRLVRGRRRRPRADGRRRASGRSACASAAPAPSTGSRCRRTTPAPTSWPGSASSG